MFNLLKQKEVRKISKVLIVNKDKKCSIEKELKQKFPDLEIKSAWKNKLKEEHFKDIDLVISIGGDGTFLSASHFIDNQLILGVNNNVAQSEGALCSIDLIKLEEKISKIIQGNYTVKEYQREEVKIIKTMKQLLKKEVSCFCDDPKLKSLANSSKSDLISDICKGDNCIKTEYPLNECFIGNINPHHPSNYTIKINNQEEKQRSSGILISTGTGSSAWYYAMGGRKFKRTKKQLRFRIREPFTGRLYKVAIKSGKINPNKKLEIISLMHHGFLAIDSIRTYKLSMNDKIEISLGKPLRVVH